jgi:hypothetical protein
MVLHPFFVFTSVLNLFTKTLPNAAAPGPGIEERKDDHAVLIMDKKRDDPGRLGKKSQNKSPAHPPLAAT